MPSSPVSVIVVSRDRGDSLGLTLTGLSRLYHDTYEIIVVADPAGEDAVQRSGLRDRIKLVPCGEANISVARNLGLSVASGDIVAFIDDDAVPEPTWLDRLTEPFQDPAVAAAGGFVIGRNGISYQWKASSVDDTGTSTPLTVDETRTTRPVPPPGAAIRTEGTNMAFRREVLARLGGFDPAYRFYLDETDLNMRLARDGAVTAIAPQALVHHAFAPSPRRAPSRAPTDLYEIGASLAVYLRRHCPPDRHAEAIRQFTASRDAALIDHMTAGRLEPRDVQRLRRRLHDGLAEGRTRALTDLPPLPPCDQPFLPFQTLTTGPGTVICGASRQRHQLRAEAAARAARGENITLMVFSPTTLYHRVRMRPEGFWEQTGGLWGRSDRTGPLIQLVTAKKRLRREMNRTAAQRGISVKKP